MDCLKNGMTLPEILIHKQYLDIQADLEDEAYKQAKDDRKR